MAFFCNCFTKYPRQLGLQIGHFAPVLIAHRMYITPPWSDLFGIETYGEPYYFVNEQACSDFCHFLIERPPGRLYVYVPFNWSKLTLTVDPVVSIRIDWGSYDLSLSVRGTAEPYSLPIKLIHRCWSCLVIQWKLKGCQFVGMTLCSTDLMAWTLKWKSSCNCPHSSAR